MKCPINRKIMGAKSLSKEYVSVHCKDTEHNKVPQRYRKVFQGLIKRQSDQELLDVDWFKSSLLGIKIERNMANVKRGFIEAPCRLNLSLVKASV